MFPPVDKDKSFPEREVEVLNFWKDRQIYHKSLEARAGAPPFVFYEGPPTANGMPHPGHCLTRAIKDLFPRYRTMRGYRCERKAGWDTHGLPVETEVSKELGIHSKEEIEQYGIEKFIHRCQASVWRYMTEWERMTERIGFWVDLENAYVTYHQSYVESVWWSLKNLFDRGLLYKSNKIVWWWAQGGTALSAGEVGQGYREVADPSVYVKFPLVGDDGEPTGESLLVWTTTPWTLPSNQYAAVNPQLSYVKVRDSLDGTILIIAEALVEALCKRVKRALEIVGPAFSGEKVVGKRYKPPFDAYFRLYGSEFREIAPPTGKSAASMFVRGYASDQISLTFEGGDWDAHLKKLDGRLEEWYSENKNRYLGWFVLPAQFVTIDSGTGVVHIAPAFGEDDFRLLNLQQAAFDELNTPPLLCPVAPNGRFTGHGPEYCNDKWVKDCDKDIIRDIKSRGLLFHQEQYQHEYPYCWRADNDPLIQYPRESWFIRTTDVRNEMLSNNAHINWLPAHIKDGRFGKFLFSNVDWALSRERFWGTPLPIWECKGCGHQEAITAFDDLLTKPGVTGFEVWNEAKLRNPELPNDLKVHKPYIDAIRYFCPKCRIDRHPHRGNYMTRVPEVIDCWYDSGAMPFAQWGYRDQLKDREASAVSFVRSYPFPADFISEAIDQTRGWFYTQLAISTLLWGGKGLYEKTYEELDHIRQGARGVHPVSESVIQYPHPFKNCIVLGLMLGEDGQKMSKSKRNYREPAEIFDRYGADALRWYFFATQPPWTSIRYNEQAIKDSVPEFLLRLWNVYSFFTIYANIDGFEPDRLPYEVPVGDDDVLAEIPFRRELDRWILSELNRTIRLVINRMDAFDNFGACEVITDFVDALSNWYVRRSRNVFWASDIGRRDKEDSYWTLYECLITTAQMVAPFIPFFAEYLWKNLAANPLARSPNSKVQESVHLCNYPNVNDDAIDEQLSARMNVVRHIASLGRQARTTAGLKVRQPLARVEVILADATHQRWLEEHCDVIADELNVKQVEFSDEPEKYVDHQVLPNYKLLGPRLGKLIPEVKSALAAMSGSELLANIRDNGKIDLAIDGEEVTLTSEEVEIRLQAKPGWTAANEKGVVVVLATELTPELVAEGIARDLVRAIQERRKELGLDFTDRIYVSIETDSEELRSAAEQWVDYIKQEVLSVQFGAEKSGVPIAIGPLYGTSGTNIVIGGLEARLFVAKVT